MTPIRTAGFRCHTSSISQWSSTWYSTTQARLHSPVPNSLPMRSEAETSQHYPLQDDTGTGSSWLFIPSVRLCLLVVISYFFIILTIIEIIMGFHSLCVYGMLTLWKSYYDSVACFLINLLNVKAWTNVSFFNWILVYNEILWEQVVFRHTILLFGLTVSSSIYL